METIEQAKEYIDHGSEIKLHDLVIDQAEEIVDQLEGDNYPTSDIGNLQEEFLERVDEFESMSKELLGLTAVCSYWGRSQHFDILQKVFRLLANVNGPQEGTSALINLKKYPSLLLYYVAGVTSVSRDNYSIIKLLLLDTKIRDPRVASVHPDSSNRTIEVLSKWDVIKKKKGQWLFEENKRTPVSLKIENALEEPLNEVFSSEDHYRECFKRFEYLVGLLYADIVRSSFSSGGYRGPVGSFIYSSDIQNIVQNEINDKGQEWPPLQEGLFGGDPERLNHVKERYDRFLEEARFR